MKIRSVIHSFVIVVLFVILAISCKKDIVNDPIPFIEENDPIPIYGDAVHDTDGNVYNTVIIGNQVWMAENLKTTKFNDGTSITLTTSNNDWHIHTPSYCWYNNDVTNKNKYGALYNWYAVNTAKLAPKGWHVATDDEWTILTNFLGESIAGGALKKTGTAFWKYPNMGATNLYGFSAFPGGYRMYSGEFYYKGETGYYWTSSENKNYANLDAWSRSVHYANKVVARGSDGYGMQYGFSVRCIKD